MDQNKNNRLLQWAVILLVLCNIGLILTIWLKPNLPFGRKPEEPRDFVIRNLKFSDDQVKKYDALISVHKTEMNRLRKESMNYRQQLFDNLKNNGQNGINPDSLSQLIANDQKQIELITYNHFAQVRTLCTNEQKETFDQIIGDVMKKMNGNGNRNNRPPGDHQGPPPPENEGRNGPPPNDRQGPPENK